MSGKDWIIKEDGQYQAGRTPREWDLVKDTYRFYRFLTELDDILYQGSDENSFLPSISKLVRTLTLNSYWLQTQCLEPSSDTDISVKNLYDEIGYPLTVQTVTFKPGISSSIHNHGTWGVVAILKGNEKNTFWKRVPHPEFNGKLEAVSELILVPGDIISFTSDAIHAVEAVGEEPLVTFNIYGETNHRNRFEFDLITHQAKNY